jgi:hypothetical protein
MTGMRSYNSPGAVGSKLLVLFLLSIFQLLGSAANGAQTSSAFDRDRSAIVVSDDGYGDIGSINQTENAASSQSGQGPAGTKPVGYAQNHRNLIAGSALEPSPWLMMIGGLGFLTMLMRFRRGRIRQ